MMAGGVGVMTPKVWAVCHAARARRKKVRFLRLPAYVHSRSRRRASQLTGWADGDSRKRVGLARVVGRSCGARYASMPLTFNPAPTPAKVLQPLAWPRHR